MGLEAATYISDLVTTNPLGSDAKSTADDHLRLIKSCLKTTFPSVTGAVTKTHTELNTVTDRGLIAGQTWTGTHTFPATTYGVTAAVGSSGTALATLDYVNAQAFSAALPAQTGNSGKFLTTDGSSASWGAVVGNGGAAITGNTTLTASSAAAMTLTPTTYGLYATLPSATTCSKAVNIFSFYNAGDYDYGLKDSTGTQLGWIKPKTGAVIGLSDNSTAAGNWVLYGVEKLGLTAQYVNTTLSNMSTNIVRVELDANRTCFVFGETDCYGIVYDASTQTWGSPTLIRATIAGTRYSAILSGTNQVLVVSCNTTTGFQGVTLSISTNTITVNTAASVVLAGNNASIGQLVAVGSSFVVSYGRATTTAAIRAITISGTTVTIGTETALDTTIASSANLFASGSIVRCIYQDASFAVTAKPYTVSGSTLSVGTAATATATAASLRTFLNANGNIVSEYINTTHFATIFKLTGTTEAASSVSLGTAPSSIQNAAYVAIGNKAVFLSAPAGNIWYANILTDTAGAASAGTEITGTVSGASLSGLAGLFVSGSTAKFAWNSSSGSASTGTFSFDCSGASPVLSDAKFFVGASTNYSAFQAQPLSQTRATSTLIAGLSAISIGTGATTVSGLHVFPNGISTAKLIPIFTTSGVIGATSSESYFANSSGSGSVGFVLSKLEMAA